ncbi:hypothetical protein KJ781_00600 [Patescibacteria group bacterium]|nr:hypothetical protein [Patescibacteria group bacterium]MBU1448729.1 hypothetical protein [Patescibacteria group bacterium]MBU2613011.1 hypothetical protein [Patescibacteria group bacterium]
MARSTGITTKEAVLRALGREVGRLAQATERQNNLRRRFFLGVFFGLGTALGASIIASVLVYGLRNVLSVIGLERALQSPQGQQILEEQIRLQTPTD